ncbi:hypothetical protein DL98DRAFT_391709, partial [Cadophora sp. DSE1049]
VDKYYIVQHNDKIKRVQLQAINRVYKLSHFTIFAIAGPDPTYGLPSVRSRSR